MVFSPQLVGEKSDVGDATRRSTYHGGHRHRSFWALGLDSPFECARIDRWKNPDPEGNQNWVSSGPILKCLKVHIGPKNLC